MRIAYGVFGYGRGHATRAEAVLSELERRHDVLVLAGGDAHDVLAPRFCVVRIPTLRYVYGDNGVRCVRRTVSENLPRIAELVFRGEGLQKVIRVLRDARPDVAVCDADPWTHRACGVLGVPRIAFDHFGLLAYCNPPIAWRDGLRAMRDVMAYRFLTGRPQRVLVSSFFAPSAPRGVRVVGPLLRDEVRARPAQRGEHLLVYFNQGTAQMSARIEAELRALAMPVVIYGAAESRDDGLIAYRRADPRAFVDDLARCRAVLSTAGNQLVGEAMHFAKPMLVVPEDTVEQRMNALALERLGVGERVDAATLDASRIRAFLGREREHAARARAMRVDGRVEAVATIEAWSRELAAGGRAPELAWRIA
jgi:uncharacterized protein (TIGR00661 family)